MSASTVRPLVPWHGGPAPDPALTPGERKVLDRIAGHVHSTLQPRARARLDRLAAPIDAVSAGWPAGRSAAARNYILAEVGRRGSAYWAWDEDTWVQIADTKADALRHARFEVIAFGYVFGGHHRLHHRCRLLHLKKFCDLVFGTGAVDPALADVLATLRRWNTSLRVLAQGVQNATLDLLLSVGSPRLEDITGQVLESVVAEHRNGRRDSRRQGLFRLSRVLADKGIIPAPLTVNRHNAGPRAETLADVPGEWLEWVQRWRKLSTCEPATMRVRFSVLLIAGRWAAERHPDAIAPDQWSRDMAAEYVADTMAARIGQWAGHNRNTTRLGEAISAKGMANRIDTLRAFFCDLVEWEWLKARFDPRRVLSLPLSVRAGLGPNPRVIDDVAWAKLMAAGLTINAEDFKPYGPPSARAAGHHQASYYPIEMLRAIVGVWLFAGCRIDEIRRLDLDCILWDEGTDDQTGETFPICLLRVPQNKTSGPFTKPVDPLVGQLIDAWKLVRSPQPDIEDRKTRRRRQHLFTHRGQLFGPTYLNEVVIPILCAKAGIPEADSRGALTSHRARTTIATQLLNAKDPLTLADLQAWLGHKHPASTRHYAAILQRTLTAAYRKADYFARNVRTIQVLIDRETILTGAAAGGEPWKFYDLGDGYCSYDFFAKCPHRLACARCPFYIPKDSTKGQLLEVKAGIEHMLEQLDLTDDERQALEGDRDAIAALTERLADVPTPAGPTPVELGATRSSLSLTALRPGTSGDPS